MKLKSLLSVSLAAVLSFSLFSCNDDNEVITISGPNALVTVKNTSDNTCFLQLDDNTTLLPVNMPVSPFGPKEVRALANLSKVKGNPGDFTEAVFVNWIDSILTKNMVTTSVEDVDKEFGNAPVEIIADWITVAEDGFLTLRFRTLWGPTGRPHTVNLVRRADSEDPYTVEFHQDANGDTPEFSRDGIVAFNITDLPDTNGETVKLTLKWNSFSGEKSTTFNYCTRKATTSPAQLNNISSIGLLD